MLCWNARGWLSTVPERQQSVTVIVVPAATVRLCGLFGCTTGTNAPCVHNAWRSAIPLQFPCMTAISVLCDCFLTHYVCHCNLNIWCSMQCSGSPITRLQLLAGLPACADAPIDIDARPVDLYIYCQALPLLRELQVDMSTGHAGENDVVGIWYRRHMCVGGLSECIPSRLLMWCTAHTVQVATAPCSSCDNMCRTAGTHV
jgi:hypothetical protein